MLSYMHIVDLSSVAYKSPNKVMKGQVFHEN